jgi:hypothetical protein
MSSSSFNNYVFVVRTAMLNNPGAEAIRSAIQHVYKELRHLAASYLRKERDSNSCTCGWRIVISPMIPQDFSSLLRFCDGQSARSFHNRAPVTAPGAPRPSLCP